MRYVKMNGCGNDFVILDLRASGAVRLTGEQARALADRRTGVGCDQVIAIERATGGADAFMRIWNANGGEVDACGNGARAVAWLLMEEKGADGATFETAAGLLHASRAGDKRVSVDMGAPRLGWRDIPVAQPTDTIAMEYSIPGVRESWAAGPGGVSMGNPHAVFFPPSVAGLSVEELGPKVENDSFFPERVNVGFAEIRAPDRIRLRVWERGAGLTKACGTGACAALVAAHRAGLAGRAARVMVDGGELEIEWRESDGHVIMTGPVALDGKGEWNT